MVAVAWMGVFAKTWGVQYVPWQAYAVLALVTWAIYAGDRLLDTALRRTGTGLLAPRHEMHYRLRKPLIVAVPIALAVALSLVLTSLPMGLFGYAIPALFLVGGFFALSLLGGRQSNGHSLLKNLFAACAFGYGTIIGVHVYAGSQTLIDTGREILCFTFLCVININAIDIWEHSGSFEDADTKASKELSITLPLAVLAMGSLISALQVGDYVRPFYYGILIACGCLYLLTRYRNSLSKEAMRVLADVALLVPIPLIWLLGIGTA